MSSSWEHGLRKQVFELAESCLQGTGSARQIAQLEDLLQADHKARKYYLEFVQDSYSLRIWALAEAERQKVEKQSLDSPSPAQLDPLSADSLGPPRQYPTSALGQRVTTRASRQRKLVLRTLAVAAGVAAVVLIAFRVFPGLGPDGSSFANRPVVASIIDARDCVWSGDRQFASGAPLRETQQLRLSAGMAQIRFQDGATVTLEGPAYLQLLSAGSARLQSGILTSYVPPQAVGFQVQTDALNVIDLGTSFGVDVTEQGQTSVSVFSGRVEVRRPNAEGAPGKVINQGESVLVRNDQPSIESIDFTADQFGKPLKAASGIVSIEGECRFLAEQAVGGMLPEDNDQILIALEGRGVVLKRDLVTNFVPKPDGDGLANGKVAPIAAGTRVDCFLVQFRPEPGAIPKRGASAAGRITFDRPILGLIARNQTLTQTDKLFAGGKTGIKQQLRGGESGENVNERELDTLEMSKDRRTIEVTAKLRKHMDQLRVLVRATDDVPDPKIQSNDGDSK